MSKHKAEYEAARDHAASLKEQIEQLKVELRVAEVKREHCMQEYMDTLTEEEREAVMDEHMLLMGWTRDKTSKFSRVYTCDMSSVLEEILAERRGGK